MKQAVVFDIGGTQSRIALVEDGQIRWRDQVRTPAHAGPAATLDMMADLFAPLGALRAPVCVAVTGQVADGCVTAHNPAIMSNWQKFALQDGLAARLQLPVRLVNDARAAAWGEYLAGSGHGCDDFMFLTVSTGIGAGLVLNGRLHLARNGFDAEIGEMLCEDGKTLEDHASGTALGTLALQHGYADARQLCDAADAGLTPAATLVDDGIRRIAARLADMAVMLGIERVAVGGGVGLRPGYLQRLDAAMQRYPAIYRVPLVAARLGHDAGLLGAAALALAD